MVTDIGPKIGVQGESEFKKQISSINQNLKTLSAETKAVTSAFIGNENSMEALTAKSELLAAQSEALNTKLDAQKDRLKKLDESGIDPTSASYQKLLQDMYNTEAALNKNEAELKQAKTAMDNLGKETDDTAKSFDDAGNSAATFGDVLKAKVLGDVITSGIHALADGVKKLGKALKDTVTDSAEYADEMLSLSQKTGLSTDELQELKYAAELVDVDLDTMTGSLTKLTQSMDKASKGSGDAYDTFKKLGIEVKNQDGSLRDRNEVFQEAITALSKIEDETNRDALAMDLFGKSAQELNPIITDGGAALNEFRQEAHDMGYVLDNEALTSLGQVDDSFQRMDKAVEGVKNQIGVALAPVVTEIGEKLLDAFSKVDWDELGEKIGDFINYIVENGDTIVSIIAGVGAGFVAWNVATMVTGLVKAIKAFQLANEGASIAQAALNVVMNANPIAIIITAVAALVAAIITLWNTNEDFRNAVINAWEKVKEVAGTVWDKIKEVFGSIKDTITGVIDSAKTWGKDMIQNLIDGIAEKVQALKDKVSSVAQTVKDFLGFSEPKTGPLSDFSTYGPDMMKLYADGIDKNAWRVENAAAGVAQSVQDALGASEKGMYASIPEPDISLASAASGIVNGMQGAFAAGGGGGTYNITLMIDNQILARATLPALIEQGRANGTPILNPA